MDDGPTLREEHWGTAGIEATSSGAVIPHYVHFGVNEGLAVERSE
jgi:hypothetical protein